MYGKAQSIPNYLYSTHPLNPKTILCFSIFLQLNSEKMRIITAFILNYPRKDKQC